MIAPATSQSEVAMLNPQPLPPSPNWAKAMPAGPDARVKITEQYARTAADLQTNGLPAPKDADFTLYLRAYWPKTPVIDGSWNPPPVKREH